MEELKFFVRENGKRRMSHIGNTKAKRKLSIIVYNSMICYHLSKSTKKDYGKEWVEEEYIEWLQHGLAIDRAILRKIISKARFANNLHGQVLGCRHDRNGLSFGRRLRMKSNWPRKGSRQASSEPISKKKYPVANNVISVLRGGISRVLQCFIRECRLDNFSVEVHN